MGIITERTSRSRSGDRSMPGSRQSGRGRHSPASPAAAGRRGMATAAATADSTGPVRRSATFSGESTLPKSSGSTRGSASSLNRSMDGSIGSLDDFDDCDNINVVVRVRPLSQKESKKCDPSVISFPGEGQLMLDSSIQGSASKQFRFNVLFEHEASQEDVMNHSGAKRMVDMAVAGYPCTIFCYGQTGSGKTHTLTGPPHLFNTAPDMFNEKHGLMFRSFVYLFQTISEQKDKDFLLKASYLEIYNEKVVDLLNPAIQEPGKNPRSLMVRWSKKKRAFFVENLFTVECEELDDLLAVLEEGLRNRAVASHNMNEFSSRSHTILSVYITSEQKAAEDSEVYLSKLGKLNFVDLAGSEMTKKTNSEGKTLEEANNINKSLMVLGTCISNLSDSKKRLGHIPYRDSKLTKLLADSLAGSGVTLMIACVSPARSNISETLNTLRYAARAKRIRTKPIVVMDPRESLIVSLKREVNILRQENEQLKTLMNIGAHMETNSLTNGDDIGRTGARLKVDKHRLHELKTDELVELLHGYMNNNEDLRQENTEIHRLREAMMRDQDVVIKENERLLRKLEDAKIPYKRNSTVSGANATSTGVKSAENAADASKSGAVNIWTNPRFVETKQSSSTKNIPSSIDRELEKMQFGMTTGSDIKERIQRSAHTGSRSAESKPTKSLSVRQSTNTGPTRAKQQQNKSRSNSKNKAPRAKMKKATSTSSLEN